MIAAVVPLVGACRRRADVGPRPASSTSAVASESGAPREAEPRVGDVVEIAPSAALASAPGGPVFANAASSPALVIGSGGGGFRRVLLADGTSGWTNAPLRRLSSARFRPQADFDINRFPPGDPRRKDVQDPQLMVTLPAGAVASVVGASLERDAPSERALRLDQAPFLEQPNLLLQFGATKTGFAHGLDIDLEWTPPTLTHLQSARGIVRRPFLEPFATAALARAPSAGATTHVLDGLGALRALPAPAHTWASLETLIHDPNAKSGAIATLAVVADGGAFAFVFTGKDKSESLVVPRAELGSPWITRVELADLDGDGRAEWLLELVDRTSEALSSRLLVVAGDSLQSKFSAAALDLGEESGESADPGQRYAWYVDGNRLFVARDDAKSGPCESASVIRSLPVYDSPPPKLAIVDSFGEPAPARARAFASDDGRKALPVVLSGKRRWATGRCFRDPKEAKAWAVRTGGRVL